MRRRITVDAEALFKVLQAFGFSDDYLIMMKNNRTRDNAVSILIDEYNMAKELSKAGGDKLRRVK